MRRIRYVVAASLDGYIAGPKGEADWIVRDPSVDFGALFRQFDTLLVGARTFETMVRTRNTTMPGMKTVVFSHGFQQRDHPGVTVVGDGAENRVAELRNGTGKDIWLFGGGVLFRSLLGAGLVDRVEVAVMPVLLGGGIPLLPPPVDRTRLALVGHKVYPTGIISLEYALQNAKRRD